MYSDGSASGSSNGASLFSRISQPSLPSPATPSAHSDQSSRRLRGGTRGKAAAAQQQSPPDRPPPPHLAKQRPPQSHVVLEQGGWYGKDHGSDIKPPAARKTALAVDGHSTRSHLKPLASAAQPSDISTSRWATAEPDTASAGTNGVPNTVHHPTSPRKPAAPPLHPTSPPRHLSPSLPTDSSSSAVSQIEAMLVKLRTSPPSIPSSSSPLTIAPPIPTPPNHDQAPRVHMPASTPVPPQSAKKIPAAKSALGGRSRWDFEGIEEDKKIAVPAPPPLKQSPVISTLPMPTSPRSPTLKGGWGAASAVVPEPSAPTEKKKTERRGRGSKATKHAAAIAANASHQDDAPATSPSESTSILPIVSDSPPAKPQPCADALAISQSPPAETTPPASIPLPVSIISSPSPSATLPSSTSPPLIAAPLLPASPSKPPPRHIDWADDDDDDELPEIDDWLNQPSGSPASLGARRSPSPEVIRNERRSSAAAASASASANGGGRGRGRGDFGPASTLSGAGQTSPARRRGGGGGASGALFSRMTGLGTPTTPGTEERRRGGRGRGGAGVEKGKW